LLPTLVQLASPVLRRYGRSLSDVFMAALRALFFRRRRTPAAAIGSWPGLQVTLPAGGGPPRELMSSATKPGMSLLDGRPAARWALFPFIRLAGSRISMAVYRFTRNSPTRAVPFSRAVGVGPCLPGRSREHLDARGRGEVPYLALGIFVDGDPDGATRTSAVAGHRPVGIELERAGRLDDGRVRR
jgi:hypothetical protein